MTHPVWTPSTTSRLHAHIMMISLLLRPHPTGLHAVVVPTVLDSFDDVDALMRHQDRYPGLKGTTPGAVVLSDRLAPYAAIAYCLVHTWNVWDTRHIAGIKAHILNPSAEDAGRAIYYRPDGTPLSCPACDLYAVAIKLGFPAPTADDVAAAVHVVARGIGFPLMRTLLDDVRRSALHAPHIGFLGVDAAAQILRSADDNGEPGGNDAWLARRRAILLDARRDLLRAAVFGTLSPGCLGWPDDAMAAGVKLATDHGWRLALMCLSIGRRLRPDDLAAPPSLTESICTRYNVVGCHGIEAALRALLGEPRDDDDDDAGGDVPNAKRQKRVP